MCILSIRILDEHVMTLQRDDFVPPGRFCPQLLKIYRYKKSNNLRNSCIGYSENIVIENTQIVLRSVHSTYPR